MPLAGSKAVDQLCKLYYTRSLHVLQGDALLYAYPLIIHLPRSFVMSDSSASGVAVLCVTFIGDPGGCKQIQDKN